MAFGEQSIARGRVAYTIHVWPTPELIDQSWTWSERWCAAYKEMAWAISLAAATQVLEGGTFAHRQIEIETEIGRAKFTISQVATTVHIVVSEFSGPNAPGPDGGVEAQPHAIEGLVIGLRGGANRSFHVVVFHGRASSIPSTNRICSDISNQVFYTMDRVQSSSMIIPARSNQFMAHVPNTTIPAWAREILRTLHTFLTTDPMSIRGNSVAGVRIDHMGESAEIREGVGIAGSGSAVIGCTSPGMQGVYFGVASMEDAYRTNSLFREETESRNSNSRLH